MNDHFWGGPPLQSGIWNRVPFVVLPQGTWRHRPDGETEMSARGMNCWAGEPLHVENPRVEPASVDGSHAAE